MSETTPDQQPTEPTDEAPETASDNVDHWRAMARKWETRAKENSAKLKEAEPIVSQWKALEEASKTAQQRAEEEASRWQTEAQNWRTKAVSSQVETLAAEKFADPSDALSALDPSVYLDAGGEIDKARMSSDLDALLERKPHWRKQADTGPVAPRIPAPNFSQGSGAAGAAATDPATAFAATMHNLLSR